VTYYDHTLIWIYNNSLYVLIWLHCFMDFFCQTNDMATKKSSSNKWLAIHVLVYSTPFLFFGIPFALINGLTHFMIDYVTSRINKRLWDEKKVHYFFCGIGVDQALHITVILWLAKHLLLAF
jgi:hypothetical protein